MIFDAPEMQRLREKYAGQSISRVPRIVFLDRDPELAIEREYLEGLFCSAPVSKEKKRDWLRRLVSIREAQHLGAWFELMLYGWLLELHTGQVIPAPQTEWGEPDFLLDLESQQVIIEGRVHLIETNRREHEKKVAEVWDALHEIQRHYLVRIKHIELPAELNLGKLVGSIENWLDTSPNEGFSYLDEHGASISLTAQPYPKAQRVLLTMSTPVMDINPKVLKAPLREKAGKYKKAREAGYIYIIALLLEPPELSADTVVEAWLGRTQYVIDIESQQVREVRTDRSGLHYFGSEVRHTTVSGTLVFQPRWDPQAGRHNLVPAYIQNPYAKAKFDGASFPIQERFVVVGQDDTGYSMSWQPKQHAL
jgi:hypothetical protein